jgi:hypothetical protein
MSITYNWTVPVTDYLVADGFITTAHWVCAGTDGTYSDSVYSTCSFAPATPSIPYNSVTEQEVLNWIWANGVDKDTVEASLQSQIDLQKNPVQATGTPWTTGA